MNIKIPWGQLLLAFSVFVAGAAVGVRFSGTSLASYLKEEAVETSKLTGAQIKFINKTEIVYRDRIQKIYLKGKTIEKLVPVFVTSDDDLRFRVNVGFVRLFNAAWAGDDPGSPAESDREPASVSLAEVSAADAFNATACNAWREIALGTRAAYLGIQAAVNGPTE